MHGLHEQADADPIHVTVPAAVRLCSPTAWWFTIGHAFDPTACRRRGQEVTPLARTLVDAWPLLPSSERTGVVVHAVGERLILPDHLVAALPAPPKAPGDLRRLASLLLDGCRSPLELWGAVHVFRRLPGLRRQVPVTVGGRTYLLDVYAEAERVDFELDGARWHGSSTQRERDLRRDARLASVGISVVRLSYQRLMTEPDEVRAEVRQFLRARSR